MTDTAPCLKPATHAVKTATDGGFYFACEACVEKTRAAFPDTVHVRPLAPAEIGRVCVVPDVNC
jgi:hypothetical protein